MASRLGGLIRLTHPFPCLLDGLVVGAVATLSGADPVTAVRLGVAMTALQASIGALNDIVDAPRDLGHKPGKPIPSGLVSPGAAWVVVAAGAALGLGLSELSGAATTILAAIVLAVGYAYDLGFKGTAWSWVPFAVGIPLLPVFGWVGTQGAVPASFAILLPVAVVAGGALAIANALPDVDRDAAAGVESIATRLGPGRAWAVHAGMLGLVVASAIATLVAAEAPLAATTGAVLASTLIAFGVAIGRGTGTGDVGSARRERAWEIEAVGVALLAAAWLAGTTLGQ